jgi:pimeloyl-[acyl-carrier protein] synthase
MGIREQLALKFGLPMVLAKERWKTGVSFNPLSADLRYDPHPLFKRLREKDPVHYSEVFQGWVVTRYDDVLSILRDSRWAADRMKIDDSRIADRVNQDTVQNQVMARTMLTVDPPDHTRLRNLVNKAFTPRSVERVRPRTQEIVDHLLDEMDGAADADVIRDLAYPLPVIVIAEMLGVPPEDRSRFKKWSSELVQTLGFDEDPEKAAIADQAVLDLVDYFREVIQQRKVEPREDLISGLIAAHEGSDALTEDEMLGTLILLLVAGNETTTNLIGNGLLSLLEHPGELERLRANPELTESAIEEMLRYEYPVMSTVRTPLEEVQLDGKTIRSGQPVMVTIAAANRDPAQFPDPDRFDIGREGNHHVAFGHGIHFCLGAPLARAEGRAAISSLLARYPDLRSLVTKPDWGEGIILRGLKTFPVELGERRKDVKRKAVTVA